MRIELARLMMTSINSESLIDNENSKIQEENQKKLIKSYKTLISFNLKPTGKMGNSKEISFKPNEKIKEIRYYYLKGIKYLCLETDLQKMEWGFKDEEIEPYIVCLRPQQEATKLEDIRFGFSLSGNKFTCMNFILG